MMNQTNFHHSNEMRISPSFSAYLRVSSSFTTFPAFPHFDGKCCLGDDGDASPAFFFGRVPGTQKVASHRVLKTCEKAIVCD